MLDNFAPTLGWNGMPCAILPLSLIRFTNLELAITAEMYQGKTVNASVQLSW